MLCNKSLYGFYDALDNEKINSFENEIILLDNDYFIS